MSIQESKEDFYREYKEQVLEIEKLLNNLTSINKNEFEGSTSNILIKIQTVQELFLHFFPYLPSYEQKSYQEEIKRLKERLTLLKNSLKPKAKFAFKKRDLLKDNTTNPVKQDTITPTTKKEDRTDKIPFIGMKGETLEFKYIKGNVININRIDKNTLNRNISINITEIEDTKIDLIDDQLNIATVYLNDVKNNIIVLPPISNSILIYNCENCVIFIASQQFRMHKSKSCKIFLLVNSNPIIEDCNDIEFYNYLIEFENKNKLIERANLSIQPERNYYNKVEDFNWLKQSASPNFKISDTKSIELSYLRSKYLDLNKSDLNSFLNEFITINNN